MLTFKNIISRVSTDFIEEATQSPYLLSDMAKMEYYMAESYSGRVLIELLQNADDAGSTKICLLIKENEVYFANNGRPFDENDLIGISRSGASEKERGQTIGYRGIGFKSTSYISKDIIIYSNGAYFTFSKSLCANILGVPENNVPTIRIPLSLERPESNIDHTVESLLQKGYTTVFVFNNANLPALFEEIKTISIGHFLFLNNIAECIIQENTGLSKYFRILRCLNNENSYVKYETDDDIQEWMIFKKEDVSIAFLTKDGIIIPCPESEAVYHCYLPTLDKSIIKCKINADFSTDPSRKHLTLDNKTIYSLNIVTDILFSILKNSIKTTDKIIFKNIFSLFINKNILSKANQLVDETLESFIINCKWLVLNNGNMISSKDYKQFPSTFDIPSSLTLRTIPGIFNDESLSQEVYETIENVDDFITQYSQEEFSINDLISQLESENFVKHINVETHINLLTNVIRETKIKSCLSAIFDYSINNMLIRTATQELHTINNVVNSRMVLDTIMRKELSERLTSSEILWFQEQIKYPIIDKNIINTTNSTLKNIENSLVDSISSLTPHITRWRDAESKCIEVEEILGNTAIDVSFRNLGYDVISKTPEGKTKYIEVKSVKKDYLFSLTNNEYTAAHQYGEDFYVCLICENGDKLDVKYIQNPLNTAKFEKRIKQWEWACIEFKSTLISFDLN